MLLVVACGENKTANTMTVNGSIKGLKKGKLFLQKLTDSTLVNLDSIALKGNGNFTFSQELESPEMFYLYLEKADNNDLNDRIPFFGESGDITINTAWNTFDVAAEISGSSTHEKYQEFQQMITQFHKKDLELAKASMVMDSTKLDSLNLRSESNLKNRYRYVINFALNNLDSPVTPYVVLSQASDANPRYLDSIAKSMTPEVAQTKYGKALKTFIAKN